MENDLHRLTSISLPAILCSLLFSWGAGVAAQSVQPQLMQASKPAIAVPSTGASVTPVAMIAPPGTTLYIAKRGDSIPLVARHYLSQTSYLTSTELAQAIRKTNADTHSTYLKPGQQVIIPGILDAPIVEKSVPVTRDFEVRAVYLTGVMAASDRGLRIIRRWREVGGNAVVFDIKDSDGSVNIHFDYVRFPAEGDQKDASFVFQTAHPEWRRTDVIADFLKHAYAELHPAGVLLSLDVFGVMAWQRQVDLAHTGQDIVSMAKYCDVISPMIYPSHFFGMDGYARPGDAPEHFISESMDRFELITKGSGVVIRPWLQAFRWRTKTYSPKYIEVQVLTAKKKGGIGFLFWNAGNDYSKPFVAMPEMSAARGEYFRGDELTNR